MRGTRPNISRVPRQLQSIAHPGEMHNVRNVTRTLHGHYTEQTSVTQFEQECQRRRRCDVFQKTNCSSMTLVVWQRLGGLEAQNLCCIIGVMETGVFGSLARENAERGCKHDAGEPVFKREDRGLSRLQPKPDEVSTLIVHRPDRVHAFAVEGPCRARNRFASPLLPAVSNAHKDDALEDGAELLLQGAFDVYGSYDAGHAPRDARQPGLIVQRELTCSNTSVGRASICLSIRAFHRAEIPPPEKCAAQDRTFLGCHVSTLRSYQLVHALFLPPFFCFSSSSS